ncbi:DUF6153 family protein [Aquipuribacter nitratireducens]|uniref:DUF6153 family protein n=1 Tax=Aquipuribacter nitratireducens TaxID=650104 RepID=A0ABW0GPE3_9MICO
MRRRVGRSSTGVRLAAILLLVAGVLGMHGVVDLVGTGAAAHTAAAGHHADVTGGTVGPTAPGHGDHGSPVHDVLVGCVLALVGVVVTLAVRISRRAATGSPSVRDRLEPLAAAPALRLVPPPPRVRLCVMRV